MNKKLFHMGMLAILLALGFTALGCLSKPAVSADGLFEIRTYNHTAVITNYFGTATDLVIPQEIDGNKVTQIDSSDYTSKGEKTKPGVFEGKSLTSVVLPDSIIAIGREAFANNNLTSVTLPDSITFIYASAFANNKITNVTFPVGGENTVLGSGGGTRKGVIVGGSYGFGLATSIAPRNIFEGNPIESFTFQGEIYGEASNALGALTPYYYGNGKKPGVYSLSGGVWSYNGSPLTELPAVIRDESAFSGKDMVRIQNIDGDEPIKYAIEWFWVSAGTHSLQAGSQTTGSKALTQNFKAGFKYYVSQKRQKDSAGNNVPTGVIEIVEEGPYDFKQK